MLMLGVWGIKVDEVALEENLSSFLSLFCGGDNFFFSMILIKIKIQTCECLPKILEIALTVVISVTLIFPYIKSLWGERLLMFLII